MSDYIGDKRKKKSSSAGGDTKQFDAVKSTKTGSGSSPRSGAASSAPAKKSTAGKSTSGSQKKNTGSGSKTGSAKGTPSQRAASEKGTSKSSSRGPQQSAKSSSGQPKKSTSSSPKKSSASSQSRSGSSGKSAYSGSSRSTSQPSGQKQSGGAKKNSKKAYSDSLEAKRNSRYEQDLHSTREAADIKRARKKRNYSRHRKLFNFMFYAAIFVAVTAVIVIMSVTVLFGIETINVVGVEEVPYTAAQIVSSCDVEKGQNLFTAPIDEAGEQIMTALPYIEECTVQRRLPSSVVITVTGAQAVGVVTDESGRRVIVSTGMRALEMVVSESDAFGIPEIEGVVVSPTSVGSVIRSQEIDHIEAAKLIVEKLEGYGIKLDSIRFSSGGNISAMYDGRIKLIIGTASNLDEKLELAALLINEGKITKHEEGDLDLSMVGRGIFTPDYVKEKYGLVGDDDSKDVTTAR